MKKFDDVELFALMKNTLYTAVVGDILDQMGFLHQFLPQQVKPINSSMRVAGRAMPVLMTTVFGKQEEPFGLMTKALDDLKQGEVYLATGALYMSATWGEILTAAARTRGSVGAVVDGYHRDTSQILSQDFPVFSRGAWAQDSAPRMKVLDFRIPIEIDSVSVNPGDLVFGDLDGVLVIPHDAEAEVINRSVEKVKGEKTVRKEIEAGLSTTEAFRRHGIL